MANVVEIDDPMIRACAEAIDERRGWSVIGSPERRAATIAYMRYLFVEKPLNDLLKRNPQ